MMLGQLQKIACASLQLITKQKSKAESGKHIILSQYSSQQDEKSNIFL